MSDVTDLISAARDVLARFQHIDDPVMTTLASAVSRASGIDSRTESPDARPLCKHGYLRRRDKRDDEAWCVTCEKYDD